MTTWRDEHYAVVDVETTGLDAAVHEVLSIGVVDVVGGRVQVGSAYYREVRPRVLPDAGNVVIHGIRPSDAAAGEDPVVVGREVVERLSDRVLVAHVAWVERAFLTRWLGPLGWQPPQDVVDTDVLARLALARAGRPPMRDHIRLGAAASLYGLPEQGRHQALGDALTTAQLLLAVAADGRDEEPALRDLLRAEGQLRRALLARRLGLRR